MWIIISSFLDKEDEEARVGRKSPTTRTGTNIHLWQFIKELLLQPQNYGNYIHWVDRQKGIFKIVDSVKVATLWGKRKNRPAMNYDKLSRSLRQYYKKGIMKKTERSQRLVYQFCHPYHMWWGSDRSSHDQSGVDAGNVQCQLRAQFFIVTCMVIFKSQIVHRVKIFHV